jgi:hypothetical protein
MVTLTAQIGGNVLPGACIPELDAHGLTGRAWRNQSLSRMRGSGQRQGSGQLFHENSIACVAVIMAVMRG